MRILSVGPVYNESIVLSFFTTESGSPSEKKKRMMFQKRKIGPKNLSHPLNIEVPKKKKPYLVCLTMFRDIFSNDLKKPQS